MNIRKSRKALQRRIGKAPKQPYISRSAVMIAKKELMAGLKVDVRKYLDASMLVRINSFLSLLKELR